METDYGKQMGKALRAVRDMHDDCIRLIHDLDKALNGYESLMGNVVTLGLGSAIYKRTYLAEGLIRLYRRKSKEDHVLGVNICFYDDLRVVEPIFIVANIHYFAGVPEENTKKGWDPWFAFLEWSPERTFNKALSIEKPSKRPNIELVTVAAAPLYTILNLEAATHLIDMVGRP
jgi:hypothetical protein